MTAALVTTTLCGGCGHVMHWHECGQGADLTAGPCRCRNDEARAMTTPREDTIAARRKAVDDLYAVFAPDVVLEAEVESIIARIVAIDCAALGTEAETPDQLAGYWERRAKDAEARLATSDLASP